MRITKPIAVFCYYVGIDALFYWMNRHAKRILTFHNILPRELALEAISANGVSSTVDEFLRIISECAKRFVFSTDMYDARSITLTFDDGYHNQYEYAFKILRSMQIPAYIFVAGDIANAPLIVDRLLHWVACAPIKYIPGSARHDYWVKYVWPKYLADTEGGGETVLRELDAIYPYSKILAALSKEYKKERLSSISENERKEMRRAGWIIGWHTWRHYPLANLSEKELRCELNCPKEFQGACFSYPFGRPMDVGSKAIGIAQEFGYPCAVSNCNDSTYNESKYFIPRQTVSANKYLLHFELSGAKYFMRTLHLLPKCHHEK